MGPVQWAHDIMLAHSINSRIEKRLMEAAGKVGEGVADDQTDTLTALIRQSREARPD